MKTIAVFLLLSLAFFPGAVSFAPSHKIGTWTVYSNPIDCCSQVVLNASRAAQKKATRTKWLEARGSSDGLSEGSAEDPVNIIIAGAPASGKGTQCEMIKAEFGVVHLSTGDMLRAAVADETEVGKTAKDFMDNGKLVPDDVIIGVVSVLDPM
jgi:adenylate kinase